METKFFEIDRNTIVLVIPKVIIESKNYSFFLNAFERVLKDKELTRKFKNRLSIRFDGFEGESKKEFEINSIRSYMQHLTQKFPYWYYFLSMEDDSMWSMMLILCKFEKIHGWQAKISRQEFLTVSMYLLEHLHKFYEQYALPKRELIPLVKRITQYFAEFKI